MAADAVLTPAQLAAARALVAHARWTWGSHTIGLRPDGALVEMRPGQAMTRERALADGLVPLLSDPIVTAHLLTALDAACGPEIGLTMARDLGEDGAPRFTCTLSAGSYQRSWTGSCLGEALASALLARWGAMDRRRGAGGKRGGAEAPTGWARAMAERAG